MRTRTSFIIAVYIFLISLDLSTSPSQAFANADELGEKGEQATPNQAQQGKQVTVVAIPGLSFLEMQPSQLATLPNLSRLVQQGAVGAMNIRTPNRSIQDVYVTVGVGATALGTGKVQTYAAEESISGSASPEFMNGYEGETWKIGGYNEQMQLQLHVTEIDSLRKANQKQRIESSPGAMGDVLKEHHIRRVSLGSSDLGIGITNAKDKKMRRYSAQMLMDSLGVVDNGALGAATDVKAVDRPYGVKTNYAQLLFLWEKSGSGQQKGITLVELGDLYRLYADQSRYSQTRFMELKEQILGEMDVWIGLLMSRITMPGHSLWIFSPEVHLDAARAKSYLSPTIRYEAESREGLLTSESTRRTGVITAHDFTVALLNEFQLPAAKGMAGLPIQVHPCEQAFEILLHDEIIMRTIYRIRPQLLYPFVTFEMIVLLVGLWYVVWGRKGALLALSDSYRSSMLWAGWRRRVMRTLLLSLLTAPVVMLLTGWLVVPLAAKVNVEASILVLTAVFVGGVLFISFMMERLRLSTAIVWLGCGSAGLIVVDGSTGAHAIKYSALGYDPMIGARYYGIGNEYMGVLIGALIIGVMAALQRRHDRLPAPLRGQAEAAPRMPAELETAAASEAAPPDAKPSRAAALAACAAFLLATGCLAAPSLGANAGGALGAAVAFGVAGVRCFAGAGRRELRLSRSIVLLAALFALGLAALWLLNSADSPAASMRESHVGRAFHALREGRLDQIGHLIKRKLRMNVHLIRASAWSKVLLTSLFVMAVLVLRPRGRLRVWQHKYPYWMHGFAANMIGAIAALLLNDSGIVAAATLIIYVAAPMLLLRMQEVEG